ncbi:GTPase IMAP family member 9-like isoform X1 [Crassostrea virginica]
MTFQLCTLCMVCCIISITREGLNLVLVGFVGGGKTSTANTILGRKELMVSPTSKVASAQGHRNGADFNLVDTPGLQSTKDIDHLHQNITTKAGISICFLVVIKLKRFTDEESFVLSEMLRRNPTMLGRTIVIFTNLREIENKDSVPDRAIERFVKSNHTLLSFLKRYGLSYFGIDNKFASENDKNKRVKIILETAKKDAKALEDKESSEGKTPQGGQENSHKVANSRKVNESTQSKSVAESGNSETIEQHNGEMTLDDHVARIVKKELETILPNLKEEIKEELKEQFWHQLHEETVPLIRESIRKEILEEYELVIKTKTGIH